MSNVEEIRAAIGRLTLEERAELASMLAEQFPDDDWDRQMRHAATSGKFDALNAQADADLREGHCRDFESSR